MPTGEKTDFVKWADEYGQPTVAIFSGSMQSPDHNFGGRRVREVDPAVGEIPSGMEGVDSCYSSDAPYDGPWTKLATNDDWQVQFTGVSGGYGPDYVGIDGGLVDWLQANSPAVRSSGSCVIKYPQKMQINKETSNGTDWENYGGKNSGLNLIQFEVTPTGLKVTRATKAEREFHFD